MANKRIDGSLTAEQLRARLNYDPETGIFTWRYSPERLKQWNTRWAGKTAGCPDGQYGYISIRIDYQLYQGHRLAWLYMTGEWPQGIVDHRNVVPDDNRWENLRLATKSQNMANMPKPKHNTTGFKGVSDYGSRRGYVAQIQLNGKRMVIGLYKTPEEAHEAYKEAATRLFGDFARFS